MKGLHLIYSLEYHLACDKWSTLQHPKKQANKAMQGTELKSHIYPSLEALSLSQHAAAFSNSYDDSEFCISNYVLHEDVFKC